MQTFSKTKRRVRAFSLIEVVIAVGIFAISIVAVIGLLGPTNKSVADVRDTDDSTRVVNSLQAELQRIAETSTGFALIGSTTTGQNTGYLQDSTTITANDNTPNFDPANNAAAKKYTFFASRDGTKIGLYTATPNTVWNPSGALTQSQEDAQKFFEIVLIRNTDLSKNDATNPDATAGFLAFTIRLRWPAYTPDGQRFEDNTQKSVLLVPAAVHR